MLDGRELRCGSQADFPHSSQSKRPARPSSRLPENRSGTQRDPDGWIYKTQEEIEVETGLSRREQETARKQLRAVTLLREERRGVPARLYYLIHVETLNAAWEEFLANKNGGNRQTGLAECAEQGWRNAPDYPYRDNYPGQTQGKEAQSDISVWDELAKLGIPNVAAYIRVTG